MPPVSDKLHSGPSYFEVVRRALAKGSSVDKVRFQKCVTPMLAPVIGVSSQEVTFARLAIKTIAVAYGCKTLLQHQEMIQSESKAKTECGRESPKKTEIRWIVNSFFLLEPLVGG
jgi:hypothetical protein